VVDGQDQVKGLAKRHLDYSSASRLELGSDPHNVFAHTWRSVVESRANQSQPRRDKIGVELEKRQWLIGGARVGGIVTRNRRQK
jgi:hypothetical protein